MKSRSGNVNHQQFDYQREVSANCIKLDSTITPTALSQDKAVSQNEGKYFVKHSFIKTNFILLSLFTDESADDGKPNKLQAFLMEIKKNRETQPPIKRSCWIPDEHEIHQSGVIRMRSELLSFPTVGWDCKKYSFFHILI